MQLALAGFAHLALPGLPRLADWPDTRQVAPSAANGQWSHVEARCCSFSYLTRPPLPHDPIHGSLVSLFLTVVSSFPTNLHTLTIIGRRPVTHSAFWYSTHSLH